MFRLLSHTCSKCNNPFKVETDAPEGAEAAAECQFRCPRCYTATTIRADAGEARPRPTPWAVRATPAPQP